MPRSYVHWPPLHLDFIVANLNEAVVRLAAKRMAARSPTAAISTGRNGGTCLGIGAGNAVIDRFPPADASGATT